MIIYCQVNVLAVQQHARRKLRRRKLYHVNKLILKGNFRFNLLKVKYTTAPPPLVFKQLTAVRRQQR